MIDAENEVAARVLRRRANGGLKCIPRKKGLDITRN